MLKSVGAGGFDHVSELDTFPIWESDPVMG